MCNDVSSFAGVINKVGKQHIGCLVHDKFNAWIPRLNPTAQNEDLAGEEIQFEVTNIFTNNNILSLKGRVEETRYCVCLYSNMPSMLFNIL